MELFPTGKRHESPLQPGFDLFFFAKCRVYFPLTRAFWKSYKVGAAIAIADLRIRFSVMKRVKRPMISLCAVMRGGHFGFSLFSTSGCCLRITTSPSKPWAPRGLQSLNNRQTTGKFFSNLNRKNDISENSENYFNCNKCDGYAFFRMCGATGVSGCDTHVHNRFVCCAAHNQLYVLGIRESFAQHPLSNSIELGVHSNCVGHNTYACEFVAHKCA